MRATGTLAKASFHATTAAGQSITRTQTLYHPPSVEVMEYDLDGNLVEDGRWLYTWDGENRLTQMTEKPRTLGPARQRLAFTYDSQSRRVRKVVESFDIQQSTLSPTSASSTMIGT